MCRFARPATGADSGILIRTCKGRKDYTGGANNFSPLSDLDDIERLAGHCQRVLAREGEQAMKLLTRALRRKPAGKERANAKHRPSRSGRRKSTTAPADGMKIWTIRCVAHLPSFNILEVEAETLEAACAKAIATSKDSPHWQIADQSGRTFVNGYCEGALDNGREKPTHLNSDVPHAFNEDGLRPRPTIKIYLSGGVIQDVSCDGAAIVIVHDADNEAEAPAFDPYKPSEYWFPS